MVLSLRGNKMENIAYEYNWDDLNKTVDIVRDNINKLFVTKVNDPDIISESWHMFNAYFAFKHHITNIRSIIKVVHDRVRNMFPKYPICDSGMNLTITELKDELEIYFKDHNIVHDAQIEREVITGINKIETKITVSFTLYTTINDINYKTVYKWECVYI